MLAFAINSILMDIYFKEDYHSVQKSSHPPRDVCPMLSTLLYKACGHMGVVFDRGDGQMLESRKPVNNGNN